MPVASTGSRLSLKNILFTTDFSRASEAALPYVRAMAKWFGAKVVVAHAVGPVTPLALPMEPIPMEMDFVWEEAQAKMNEFVRSNPLSGARSETALCRGDLWNTIPELISKYQIDLVVLGTHGREGVKKLVLGSGAEQIFRRADCPVLSVGPNARGRDVEFESWKHILFATDFSEGSLHALPYALSIAEENQAQLTLAHFVSLVPMQHQTAVEEQARKRLRSLLPEDATDWCTPECVVRFEFPSDGILKVGQEREADLIVMGVHKSNVPRAAAHMPWAIAYEVVCHAGCPVLTVRG
jgi:nucleotide-binding universal stress UspA family protein